MNRDTMSGFERGKTIPGKTGGPAFPVCGQYGNKGEGMSLRDWFAGQVLAGLVTYDPRMADVGYEPSTVAGLAYKYADAMIAARGCENGQA